ncbi:Protein MAIN-LIKE 2 [Glycine soja]
MCFKRPTTSARRQQKAAPVAEDVDDMDQVDEEVYELPEETASVDVPIDAKGFPGGPHDTSVLQDYVYHVATKVWSGEERPELKLCSHGRKVKKFGRPTPEIEGLVATTRLSPLITCSLDTGDRGLMSAFVEREVTITLDDVASLLHLPITCAFHSFQSLHVDDIILLLVELLELSARAYLLRLLGCTLFANKSVTHVYVAFLVALRDLTQSVSYAWGAVVPVHMYDNLNDASKSTTRQLAGYITLLQCWIYEHFPSVGCVVAAKDYDERKPRACCWKSGKALLVSTYCRLLDRLTSDAVSLTYQMRSIYCHTLTGEDCTTVWPHVQQHDTFVEPHVAQHPVATMGMNEAAEDAHASVERPRHAVEACQPIAERLERLLNLRIIIEGTETYDVMEDCLRIARGVTADDNVYVRLR